MSADMWDEIMHGSVTDDANRIFGSMYIYVHIQCMTSS